jgi:hypothetical protein
MSSAEREGVADGAQRTALLEAIEREQARRGNL